MDREDIKMLVNKWWEIYLDESLDYNNNNNNSISKDAAAEEHVKLGPFISALSDKGNIDHQLKAPSAA